MFSHHFPLLYLCPIVHLLLNIVQIKRCCEILTTSHIDGVQAAVNAVRYSTKNFEAAETPEEIKEMFESK